MGGRENTHGIEPATLHKVMQETIGYGLRERYRPDKEIPHELLVLMMQINEDGDRDQESDTEH